MRRPHRTIQLRLATYRQQESRIFRFQSQTTGETSVIVEEARVLLDFSRRSFAGHESFTFRSGWLKKGYDLVVGNPMGLTDQDHAMVAMGVGKNMVRSIRHWCLATGVLESEGRHLRPTSFGTHLFDTETGWDPYLEDPASLWLLHGHLGMNNEKATTFYAVLSGLPRLEFTREQVVRFLEDELRKQAVDSVAEETLRRDTDIFLRTYTPAREARGRTPEEALECPLTELGFLHLLSDGRTYAIQRGERKTLPNAVLAYLIVRFWNGMRVPPPTLSWRTLLYDPASPGRVLRMDEAEMGQRVELLVQEYPTVFQASDNSGIKQLQRGPDWPATDAFHLVNDFYLRAQQGVLR